MLSDGVAGHDRSSQGILSALEKLGPIDPVWLPIKEKRPKSRRLARLSAATGPGQGRPERFADFHGQLPTSGDLVVSTGPATAATNIALTRKLTAKNVFYGFPKWPVVGITVLLSPLPARAAPVAVSPRPSTVDVDLLPPPRALAGATERRMSILFGGDTKHYKYTRKDCELLATQIRGLLKAAPHLRVDLYDSRRTVAETFDVMVAALRDCSAVTVHRFRDGGLGSNQGAFEADAVLVSVDSLSMISEAIAAGRPTLVIKPRTYTPSRRDARELGVLADLNLIRTIPFDAISPSAVADLPRPSPRSGPQALAALLAERGLGA